MAKRIPDDVLPLDGLDVVRPKARKSADESGKAAKRLYDLYTTRFIARHGCKPDLRPGKDMTNLKQLVAQWGEEAVRDLLELFLDPRNRDPRVLRSDFSVGAFRMLAQHLMLHRGRPADDRTQGNVEAALRAMQPRA